ncbi:hypothetical protein [Streptomyces sp. NPDC048581]|uniref:hypothetical protein n=1 Tax=unclassified Streptomyces TaxID=2593676 RepID=UPI00371AB5E2
MHTTTSLRIMAAALLTGGFLAVAAVGTPAAAVDDQSGLGQRNECRVRGDHFDGNLFWYWLVGSDGRVIVVFVDSGQSHIPDCHDSFHDWNNGSWNNWDPSWNQFR